MTVSSLNINSSNSSRQSLLDQYISNDDRNSYTKKIYDEQGEEALLSYLSTKHEYTIATIGADWGILSNTSFLLGKLGHHAFVTLTGKRVCEWTPTPTDPDKTTTQVEKRIATGWEIEKMWRQHLTMKPLYHQTGFLKEHGYLHYKPFLNDCFTYVNNVLDSAKQPPTQLSRI